MTTNQLTYQGLMETERANRANEALKAQQIEADVLEKGASTDLTRAKIEELNQRLPSELRLTEAQIDKAVSDAAKNYQGIGRVTESSSLVKGRDSDDGAVPNDWLNWLLDDLLQIIKTATGVGSDITKLGFF